MLEPPNVPDRYLLKNVEELCLLEEPYIKSEKTEKLFLNAMKEIVSWHKKKSSFYLKLIESKNFALENIDNINELLKLPFVTAEFFKRHEVLSIDKKDVYLHLTSSGTTGQKSQIFFDKWTISVAQRMVDLIFNYYNWVTPEKKCNYLLYSYEPLHSEGIGTAYTDNFLCKYAPINDLCYAIKYLNRTEHRFDLFGVVDKLIKYQSDGLPVRIFGFPSFLYFTIEYLKERKIKLNLNPESLVFLGGGWKGYQDKAINKIEFYGLVEEYLGIPNCRLRDGFGSVEHCIPYIECQCHNFHVPIWSKVFIRNVKTLEANTYDQIGYLNFISPYITSTPAINVLMNDLAILHPANSCKCGMEAEWFEVVGRASHSSGKSCAISASEILKKF